MTIFNKKALLIIVTLCIVLVSTIGEISTFAYSKSTPTISGEVVSSQPNSIVNININMSNNPGIVSATINVSFDSNALSLTKVKDGGLIGTTSHKPELTSPYTLAWVNDTATKNYTSNGTIVTLTFKIKNTASYGQTYPIIINYDYENYDVYDKDLNIIKFQTINGAVKISIYSSFILGDANRDSKVTIKDTSIIQRFIAHIVTEDSVDIVATDVDEDGYTTIIDVTFIQQYLAKDNIPYPIGKTIN